MTPRVRSDPNDGNSAGTQWFELFGRLRTLPTADRPTTYTVQSILIAGVYAVGLGKLSKAFALLAEAITLSIDSGLHRSADAYDIFDPIEDEVRKRTFWCVYMWDKQACAHFGRPPMIRLRDCDVGEPAIVDDEYITRDGINVQHADHESRMSAFVSCVRVFVVLESILDGPPFSQLRRWLALPHTRDVYTLRVQKTQRVARRRSAAGRDLQLDLTILGTFSGDPGERRRPSGHSGRANTLRGTIREDAHSQTPVL